MSRGTPEQIVVRLDWYTGTPLDLGIQPRRRRDAGRFDHSMFFDFLQQPSIDGTKSVRDNARVRGRRWYVEIYDSTEGRRSAAGHTLPSQVTVHTLPNRADTDADGMNDSKEVNLASDGFATDPWLADSDADGLANNEYFTKGTNPARADTDRDGTPDNRDRWPLQDACVEICAGSFALVTQSYESSTLYAYPYIILTDAGGNQTVSLAYAQTPCVSLGSGSWVYCSGTIDHTYTIDLPDDAPSATLTVEMRQDRSRHNTGGDVNAPVTPSGSNVARRRGRSGTT